MPFETFQIVYLATSVTACLVPFWLLRKSRQDLLMLVFILIIFLSFSIALHLGVTQDIPDTLVEEHVFRALTHFKTNIFLTLGNVFLWGVFPVGIWIVLRAKKHGTRLVWVVYAIFTLLKTFSDDYLFNHTYPETLVHPYEWDSVLLTWSIVYALVALFITKGINAIAEQGSCH